MVLTSGPFPSGAATDLAVERHLAQCPSCWRIADALRPASDLFHEAVVPAEGRGLPGYWGDAAPPQGGFLSEAVSTTPALTRTTLTLHAAPRTKRAVGGGPSTRIATWGDIGQVTLFVAVVISAACGLVWIFA